MKFFTRYGYDKAGRAVILIAANGQTSSNTYDALGRLTDRVLYKTPAMDPAQRLAQFKWQHDLLGNVTKQEEIWPGEPGRATGVRSTTMGYDDNNRLTTETISHLTEGTQSTTYTYDDANNRETKTITGGAEPGHWDYDYNAANQLTAWEHLDYPGGSVLRSASLTYDDAGNRTSQTIQEQGTPNQEPRTTAYTWDAQDRLSSVTLPATVAAGVSTPSQTFRYTYDYRTRRISTHETSSTISSPPSAAKHTAIVFSGGLSVADWEQESGTGFQPVLSASPTVEYTRGPDMGGGVGGLLYTSRSESASASVSSSRTLRYNLSNGRGDIVAQSDAYASLTWTASYEAYGKRTKETGENKDKQRGNSKDEDPTGLLNEGFRYRDIETGVWLSRDPAGFVDGPNLYAYVKQNPWSYFDPKGLEKVTVSGQPGDHKGRRHMLDNGFDRAKKMVDQTKKEKSKEKVTWLVYDDGTKAGHSKKDLKEFQEKSAKAGINMKIVATAKDIVEYINEKGGATDPRASDKITSFSYLGHASPGNFLVGFIDHGIWNQLVNDSFKPAQLKGSAFASGCDVNLVGGCRTAIANWMWQSTSDQFANIVDSKSIIKAANIRVNYGTAKVDSDHDLVEGNKGPQDEHGQVVEQKGRSDAPPPIVQNIPVGY